MKLTTDETFDESSIGQYLPEGRRYLEDWREWKKQRLSSSESESELSCKRSTSTTTSTSTSTLKNNGVIAASNTSEEDVLLFLRTEESFPIQLLTEENESSSSTNEDISSLFRSSRGKRKGIVFLSSASSQSKTPSSCCEKTIRDSIPPNASGVVGVMGRKINMERLLALCGNDNDNNNNNNNPSVYSMLRSWVKNDPFKSTETTITNNALSASDGHRIHERKALMDYAAMKKKSDSSSSTTTARTTSDENNNNADTDTVDVNKSLELKQQYSDVVVVPPPTPTATSTTQTQPFDLIKWLDTDPTLRMTIPYYPDAKELLSQAATKRHTASTKKAAAKARAVAKRRLISKGILL